MPKLSDLARREWDRLGEGSVPSAAGSVFELTPESNEIRLEGMLNTHPKVEAAVLKAAQFARLTLEGRRVHMALLGDVGGGKTHIARALTWVERLTVNDVAVAPVGAFFKSGDLLAVAKTTTSTRDAIYRVNSAQQRRFEYGKPPPVLVIDDIGIGSELEFVAKENMEATVQSRFTRIMDCCLAIGVNIVLTTNLTIAGLGAHMGAPAFDRFMTHTPDGFVRDMFGVPSFRQVLSGRNKQKFSPVRLPPKGD